MVHPETPKSSARDKGLRAGRRKTQKVLDLRTLLGTVVALAALGAAAYFWHEHESGLMGSALKDRAEDHAKEGSALKDRGEAPAAEKEFAVAASYYTRYLDRNPEDAGARLRRAELFEQSTGDRGGINQSNDAIKLYREALLPANQPLSLAKQLQAQRRLTELLVQTEAFDEAKEEMEKVRALEEKELAKKPEEWRWPGLNALILAGRFSAKVSAQSSLTTKEREKIAGELGLDAAFGDVLEPEKASKPMPKVFKAPEVYLARHKYHLQRELPADMREATASGAFLKVSDAAGVDLEAALNLAPKNITVLLAAATAAAAQCEVAAAQKEPREKFEQYFAKAYDAYERAVTAAPTDPRAYTGLGRLYKDLGDYERAIQTWRRGLKKIKVESDGIFLDLDLADALIQQREQGLADAEKVLKNLNDVVATLEPKARLSFQRLVDLRSAKLAYLRGQYDQAIDLVADLAGGKDVVQGGLTTPQVIYDAYIVLGRSNAALMRRDKALTAFEQAALVLPQEPTPLLDSAEIYKADGRLDTAIVNYQRALDIVNAMKPAPERLRQAIYEALIPALRQGKRNEDADRLESLRREQMGESAEATLQGVARAIRDGKPDEAVKIAESGVGKRSEDWKAYLALSIAQRASALGLAEQAKKYAAEATAAKDTDTKVTDTKLADARNADAAKADAAAVGTYQTAFEKAKDAPAQVELASFLLKTNDPANAAVAEKALRDLTNKYPPACLPLVRLLQARGKSDEALKVAQSCVESSPKDSVAHVALGIAWREKKNNEQAEAAFKKAVELAPNAADPAFELLQFYVGAGKEKKLARETLEELVRKSKASEIDKQLLRADGLALLGDRKDASDAYWKDARDAYRKAVELSKDDPVVQMRLANFLVRSSDPADEAEGENVLRRIMQQHDPARRRLIEILISRGGEQEWEEARKLLEQSAGDPSSTVDRFIQARTLALRGGTENLEEAGKICTALLGEAKQPPAAVCLLLGQIRERQGNLDDAHKQFKKLVAQEHPPANQLALYVNFLLRNMPAAEPGQLRNGLAAEADHWIKQLETLRPEDLGTLELRARWLGDQKRTAEIEPLVEGVAQKLLEKLGNEDPRQEALLRRAIGDLYTRIEQYPLAQRWYRTLVDKNPEAYQPLAMALAKESRIQEAIALCEKAGETDTTVKPALTLTRALLSGRATDLDLKSADPFLTKAFETFKDQPELLGNMLGIRVLQGRYEEAIELGRRLLKLPLQERNVEVRNNLATLLAERSEPERKEAMDYVNRAIELAGPQARFLDTKGMIFFYDGNAEEALKCLRQAAQSLTADPRHFFHLAAAYEKLDRHQDARAALKRARDTGLDDQLLTKKDRELLADLEKKPAKP